SFGSSPALEVAARLGDAVDGVVSFGGYADFEATVRFALDGVVRAPGGDVRLRPDPLNPPVVFLNVLRWLEPAPPEPERLASAWRRMAYATWGKLELKAPGRLEPIAAGIAAELPTALREPFLVGCG